MSSSQSTSLGRVIFALPVIGQPRYSKRISMLQQTGFTAGAVAFERDYHSGRLPNCDVIFLRKISHGKYLRRVFSMATSLFKMRRAIQSSDMVYAFGLDMALLTMIAGVALRRHVIIEIGDIRKIQVSDSFQGRLIRFIDRLAVNRCSLLVVTSSDFATEYYEKRLRVNTPTLTIENKLEGGTESSESLDSVVNVNCLRPLIERPLRIGYFGLLRCEWSFRVLYELAKEYPKKVFITLAGLDFLPNALKHITDLPNVEYLGQYKSPEDLQKLYGGVDIVWGCYPPIAESDWNLRWARPNRFYEACFFRRPLISRKGSNDGKIVDNHRIGLVTKAVTPAEFLKEFEIIDYSRILEWKKNMAQLEKKVYLYTCEPDELKQKMCDLLSERKVNKKTVISRRMNHSS